MSFSISSYLYERHQDLQFIVMPIYNCTLDNDLAHKLSVLTQRHYSKDNVLTLVLIYAG